METTKMLFLSSKGFILISAISFLSVSLMAFTNPQSVMDLVDVQLNSTDAISSIRGVYGGVGFVLFITLIYLMISDLEKGLFLLLLLWGAYALSRTITILIEGPLGSFGKQWLTIESVFFLVAATLLLLQKSIKAKRINATVSSVPR